MVSGKLVGVVVLAVAVLMGASNLKPHSEKALLSDWSAPPPWPIFIALNALAGALRAASDALTPPPIKMLELATGFHHTILVHIAQKFKIPDLLADGPLSAAEIATKVRSDAQYIERIMYACAANGVFKLAASELGKGHRFVNTALSAVLRVDHPNSMRGMVGHMAEEGYPACGRLADFLAKPNGPIAWDLAFPEYPFAKGGVWSFFERLCARAARASAEQLERKEARQTFPAAILPVTLHVQRHPSFDDFSSLRARPPWQRNSGSDMI